MWQVMIVVVAASVYLCVDRRWIAVAAYFAVMQVFAVAGAMWAARLRRLIEQRNPGPLRPRN
jgi:hypothetical protein